MNTKKNLKDVYEFIDRAIKSRKYPENTGNSLKTALNLFEKELNDEEKESVEEFKKNLDAVYQSVFSKNKNFTAASLATYKSRVVKVLGDFEKYGVDLTKMTHWSPKVITRAKRQVITDSKKNISRGSQGYERFDVPGESFHSFEFSGGIRLVIPKTAKFTDAIMDGGLKDIKTELKEFAETNSEVAPSKNTDEQMIL